MMVFTSRSRTVKSVTNKTMRDQSKIPGQSGQPGGILRQSLKNALCGENGTYINHIIE